MRIRKAWFIPLLLLGFSACGSETHEPGEAAGMADGASAGESAPDAAPLAPLSSQASTPIAAPAAPSGGSAVDGAGIHFELPQGWKEQVPENNMRLAQAEIPGPGGPGTIAVFFFGEGGGGGAEANLQRWAGQMELAPGSSPKREMFEANGLRISLIDASGTLQASQMGMGPETAQPDYRLLGAVVEGPGGPWFFKATGPEATLAAQRDAFLSMLKNLRVG